MKRQGDGPTHWHSDLGMAPLDTNDFVTMWLPLQVGDYNVSKCNRIYHVAMWLTLLHRKRVYLVLPR